MLDDGTYDVLVIDADDGGPGRTRLELTILAGPHKGEVVAVDARDLGRDPVEMLGVPGTLVVADGEPHVHLEP